MKWLYVIASAVAGMIAMYALFVMAGRLLIDAIIRNK